MKRFFGFSDGFRFGLGLCTALVLVVAGVALAAQNWNLDKQFRSPEVPYIMTMCSTQTGTGVCTSDGLVKGAGNLAIEHENSGAYTMTLIGTASTATAYSCDVYTNDAGWTTTGTDKQIVTSSPMTQANQVWAFSGLLDWWWVECSTITGGNVTMKALVAPL